MSIYECQKKKHSLCKIDVKSLTWKQFNVVVGSPKNIFTGKKWKIHLEDKQRRDSSLRTDRHAIDMQNILTTDNNLFNYEYKMYIVKHKRMDPGRQLDSFRCRPHSSIWATQAPLHHPDLQASEEYSTHARTQRKRERL